MAPQTIVDIRRAIDALETETRAVVDRLYSIDVTTSRLRVPPTMAPWVEQQFGSVANVEEQTLVRIDNRVTGEGALFNSLRALRPVQTRAASTDNEIARSLESDALADPPASTPEDTFGRVANEHGVTAANVARYDAHHSLIVFGEPDPLSFTPDAVAGHVELALRWFDAAQTADPDARYPYLMWNCLWRAGGSLVHGHAQLSLARNRHYAKVERLRADADTYRQAHGANYFDDLWHVHDALRLGIRVDEVQAIAVLTPLKEREVWVCLPQFSPEHGRSLARVLRALIDGLGVQSFNVGVLMPPLDGRSASWDGFPIVARIIDRGPLHSRTSDFGGMELFAQSVVAADPFEVARTLRSALGGDG